MKSFQRYPYELERLEAAAIRRRREVAFPPAPAREAVIMDLPANAPDKDRPAAEPTPSSRVPAEPAPAAAEAGAESGASAQGSADEEMRDGLPRDAVGLALSGGGIRSATFCLGFLQALANRRLLRHIDILSTVSGGGYVGAFLGRFYDRLRLAPTLAPNIVERAVGDSSSAAVRWLREHGEFLAPAGKSDLTTGFATFIRNVLTLLFVLLLLLFGLYGLANGLRYGLLERLAALLPYAGGVNWVDMPLGHLVAALGLHVFWSPWFMLVELVLLLGAVPQGIGYWLASQDDIEGYSRPVLVVALVLFAGLLWLGVRDGLTLHVLLLAAPILLALAAVEWAWRRVREENAAVGTGGPRVEQLRARTHLTRDLGMWLAITGVLLYFAVIDTLGHAIFEAYGRRNVAFVTALAQLGGGLVALYPVLRAGARFIADLRSKDPNPNRRTRLLARPAVSAILSVLLLAPPLLVISFAAHAAFNGGDPAAQARGWALTGVTLFLSFVLARPWAIAFVNRSSLQATYAARIARAFLGASNPIARQNLGDDVAPGDDVDELPDYRPFEAGGPLHLINVCVNQTVDEQTLRSARARMCTSLACSSVGLSIDRFSHAKWVAAPVPPPEPWWRRAAARRPAQRYTVKAVAHVPGTPHPLLGADGEPPDAIEMLPLRDWVSVSGAAFGPGMGEGTNAALSVLFTLANLRTGYWWNSGLTAGERGTRPRVSFVRRVLWLLPRLFETQMRLLHEALALFRGPWDRFWYLSDGGHFENLGGYELVRRRVPYIIMIDGSADPDYDFDGFAGFQRKVRIDFGAEIEPFGQAAWASGVAADLQRRFDGGANPAQLATAKSAWQDIRAQVAVAPGEGGPFDQLASAPANARSGRTVGRHAALFRVVYHAAPYARPPRPSLLLYVKASLAGDEPSDVQHYHLEHPDFPHEGTADQFFQEPQWESYRQLGQHIGDVVLGPIANGASVTDGIWLTKL